MVKLNHVSAYVHINGEIKYDVSAQVLGITSDASVDMPVQSQPSTSISTQTS